MTITTGRNDDHSNLRFGDSTYELIGACMSVHRELGHLP